MATAYETLQQTFAAKQAIYDAADAKFKAVRDDAGIASLKAILNDPRVVNTVNGWIDGGSVNGTFWKGADAQQARTNAIASITKNNADVTAAANARTDALNQLNIAKTNLSTYENSSPVLGADIAARAADVVRKNSQTVLLIVGVLGAIALLFAAIKAFAKNKLTT